MLRSLMSNKLATMIVAGIVLVAIWKYNDGDLANIVDAVWGAMNKVADSLIQLWDHFFNPKKSG